MILSKPKFKKVMLSVLILSFFALTCPSQNKNQPNLIIETENTNCEELKALVNELFQNELETNKNLTGYIIIYGNSTKRLRSYFIEQILKNFISYQKYDSNRIKFDYAKSDKIKIAFWVVPNGGKLPSFLPDYHKYILPKTQKSLAFYNEYEDNMGACDTYPFEFDELFARILENNHNLTGQIEIFESKAEDFQKRKTEILQILTKTLGVPRRKLKVHFVRTNQTANVIYRLIPNNSK